MFDIGFSELLIFAIIALVILGPDKLPRAAKTVGGWYAKTRYTITNLQNKIAIELDIAETRKQMQEELIKIKIIESNMQKELDLIRSSANDSLSDFNQSQSIELDSSKQEN